MGEFYGTGSTLGACNCQGISIWCIMHGSRCATKNDSYVYMGLGSFITTIWTVCTTAFNDDIQYSASQILRKLWTLCFILLWFLGQPYPSTQYPVPWKYSYLRCMHLLNLMIVPQQNKGIPNHVHIFILIMKLLFKLFLNMTQSCNHMSPLVQIMTLFIDTYMHHLVSMSEVQKYFYIIHGMRYCAS